MVYRTLACSVLFVFALAPLGAQAPAGKEELKLKLPKPMFIGTPTNLRSPNLEKVTGKSRGAVLRAARAPSCSPSRRRSRRATARRSSASWT